MKRNWDVIRNIFEQIESDSLIEHVKNNRYLNCVDNPDDYLGHIELLIDAGLVRNCHVKQDAYGNFNYWDFRGAFISMAGHDLLDAMRDKTVWNAVRKKATQLGISLSWEFLKAAIPKVIQELL